VNRAVLTVTGWLLLAGVPAVAQETQRGIQTVEPEAGELSGRQVPALFDRTPVLPEPSLPAGERLAEIPVVFLRSVRIEGGTVLDDADVAAVAAPYTGRDISMEELNELRNRLSLLYFDRGYVNSGVVLPDQKIGQGEIVFTEVLGRLVTVELQGNRHLNDRFWLSRIQNNSKKLNINELQDNLQVIEQNSLVRRIEARLMPGAERGEGVLYLDVHENRPWRVIVGADNHRSPSLGGEQLTLYLAHLSLTGRGDVAEMYANLADGLGDYGAAYTLPLNRRDTALRAYFSAGDAEIVEAPFDLIDIRTRTSTWGLELSHPFIHEPDHALKGILGVEAQHSESTLLGMPWSFSLGEIDGEADAVAAVGGFEWTRRSVEQVFALRMTLRQGTDWLGAEVNEFAPPGLNGPDTDFLTLRGQFQYVRRLDWLDSELHLRAALQLARDPLLPVEKMPVGGFNSVRGYRENLLVRDNGLVASAEWRLPLFSGREMRSGFDWRSLTGALFADFGQSWDQDTGLPSDRKQRIYSVGAGLIWTPLPGLSAYTYYGEALKDLNTSGGDLQDRGWHFRVSYQLF